jgi:folylpolyglutamate synthase/dihydropteroate synthase
VIVTRPSNTRAAPAEELASRIRELAPALDVEVIVSPRDAVERATTDSPFVVVAGSIFLLGEVIQEFGA